MSYKSLKSLLTKMDTIEGTTEGGRNFKIKFNLERERFYTQIFSNGSVYEPFLKFSDVLKNNILSTINRIDKDFFDIQKNEQHMSETKRKTIVIKGNQLETLFTVKLKIEDDWIYGDMLFNNKKEGLRITKLIPDHIPINQRHNYLYLHFQKPEVLLELIKFNIKDKYYNCCDNDINGRHNYCFTCGKKQVVDGLKISEIIATELLTLLT